MIYLFYDRPTNSLYLVSILEIRGNDNLFIGKLSAGFRRLHAPPPHRQTEGIALFYKLYYTDTVPKTTQKGKHLPGKEG